MNVLQEKDFPNPILSNILSDPLIEKELKIGVGAGRFLFRLASRYKSRFIVGVEYKKLESNLAAAKLDSIGLTNAVVVNMEALDFIHKWVHDNTFQAVHVYFPTPYPDIIGLSHRLIEPNFVREVFRILLPLGTFRLVSDHKKYFDEAIELFEESKWWRIEWQKMSVGQKKGYFTNSPHEHRYRREGREIYNVQFLCHKK